MLSLLYNTLLVLYGASRRLRGKSRDGWAERMGGVPRAARAAERPRIWFHAVSVGEVLAALPVLRALQARLPEYAVTLSVITPGGYETARRQAAEFADILYFPFDLPGPVRRALDAVQPRIFITMEGEYWPNFLRETRRRGIPSVVINGRVSDRNFRRARKVRWLYRRALENMDRFLMQSRTDANRIIALGAEAGRVAVMGNVKFDQAAGETTPEETAALRAELRLPPDAPVFVVGSARSEPEERDVIAAYAKARAAFPNLCLILAPRRIERADAIADVLREAGLRPVRRTRIAESPGPAAQVILDTFGELDRVYALADVVFTGNSLYRLPGGGQNFLQALAYGKPVLFGPHNTNFRDAAPMALEAGVARTVTDAETLAAELVSLLRDPAERARIGERAKTLVAENRGATARYVEAIAETLAASR